MWEFGWNLGGFSLAAWVLPKTDIAITNYKGQPGTVYAVAEFPPGSGDFTVQGIFPWAQREGNFPYGFTVEGDSL